MAKKISLPCEHVSHTAWLVAAFRAQESARKDAHFHDPLAQKLLGDLKEQYLSRFSESTRSEHWYLTVRTCLIDALIQKCIALGVKTFLNLGAGLDTRPYRMDIPPNVNWYEADYGEVVDYKNMQLAHEKPKCNLMRIAVDLIVSSERRQVLKLVNAENAPTMVLTEGLLPYLREENVIELAKDLFLMPSCQYWVVDVMNRSLVDSMHFNLEQGVENTHENDSSISFDFLPEDTAAFIKPYGWTLKEFCALHEGAIKFNRFPQGVSAHAMKLDRGFQRSGVCLFQARAK